MTCLDPYFAGGEPDCFCSIVTSEPDRWRPNAVFSPDGKMVITAGWFTLAKDVPNEPMNYSGGRLLVQNGILEAFDEQPLYGGNHLRIWLCKTPQILTEVEVYLDDQYIGTTTDKSISLKGLRYGQHTIRAIAPGFIETIVTFTAPDEELISLTMRRL